MQKTMIEYKDNRNSRTSTNVVKPVTTLKLRHRWEWSIRPH